MSVLEEILEWSHNRPMWQRDALRRLLQNESGLSDSDYSELYALLKKENGIEADNDLIATPLARDHLQVAPAPEETVTLVALRELENVNRIPNDQTLKFSETGMTVIYGGNGSGKSGYARVMKRACRARGQLEPIYPNANVPAAAENVPTAKFDVMVTSIPKEIAWSHDATSPDILSTISVFDSQCARSYLTERGEVAYLPYGSDIIENLANQVMPDLSKRLKAELDGINIEKLPYEHLQGETSVGKVIADLSAKSDKDAIKTLGTLTEEETNHATQLEKVLNEADPLSKAEALRLSAMRLKEYAGKLAKPLKWVSSGALERLQEIVEEREAAETAETKAANALRAGKELLPGTGEQIWKLLFEAARRYSTEVAYPEEEFPSATVNKVCPLCQEELGEIGTQRLHRFDDYIKKDIAKTAATAREKVDSAKGKIETADIQIATEPALRNELREMDASLIESIDAFQECINSRRDSMLQCLETKKWEEIPALIESPRNRVRQLAANQLKVVRTLIRSANEDKKKKLTEEFNELSARQSLAKSLQPVLDLLQRMKDKAALEKCDQSLKTRPISDKSKQLVTDAVTENLKNALNKEFNSLGFKHIQTELKPQSERGKTFHQLVLASPITKKINEILSEGEQRAIALGSFLAELSLANHSCGIVFDDPVSSLDHWRRKKVAQRLTEEAKKRQVIIFTHDTSFLEQLCEEIDAAGVPSSKLFLEWQGESPGYVNDGLPWDHQGYDARIKDLELAQGRLAEAWPEYPGEKGIGQIRHEYDRLRTTLERVIQDVVFNGVIKRYQDWVRVNNLAGVVGFDREEYETIAKLYKKISGVIPSHDSPSAKATTFPTAIELGNDIASLNAIVKTAQNRRKVAK